MHQNRPNMQVRYEDVPVHSVSGFFGGLNPNEASISFFQDQLIPRVGNMPGQIVLDTIEHTFVANVKMSPVIFKRMALWMMEHIKRYESQFGEIQIQTGQKTQGEDSKPPAYYG